MPALRGGLDVIVAGVVQGAAVVLVAAGEPGEHQQAAFQSCAVAVKGVAQIVMVLIVGVRAWRHGGVGDGFPGLRTKRASGDLVW